MKKKKVLFLAAAVAASLPLAKAASAVSVSIFEQIGSAPGRAAENSRLDVASDAVCTEVEVLLDEGYGVSGRETRRVCEERP